LVATVSVVGCEWDDRELIPRSHQEGPSAPITYWGGLWSSDRRCWWKVLADTV